MTKIAHFRRDGRQGIGVVRGGELIDLRESYNAVANAGQPGSDAANAGSSLSDPLTFLQGGAESWGRLRVAVEHVLAMDEKQGREQGLLLSLDDVELLPPITNPPKIICVARNYGKHAEEAGRPVSEIPILFARFPATLVAHKGDVVVPRVSDQLDWEGELAVIIGTGGRHITKVDAMDHVAGYSVFNDVTVRDYQFRVTQYTEGKNFHASGPFGPYLVLKDEVPNPHNLRIETLLNGETVQDGNTEEMIFDIPTIISHISEFIELEPGDVIPMGTPAGVGFTRNPPRFLTPGDTIEVRVENIGSLTNPVIKEEA